MPFRWIKKHLEDEYKIKCKSISNFFVGLLDDYELAGGNRNRSIVLESKYALFEFGTHRSTQQLRTFAVSKNQQRSIEKPQVIRNEQLAVNFEQI